MSVFLGYLPLYLVDLYSRGEIIVFVLLLWLALWSIVGVAVSIIAWLHIYCPAFEVFYCVFVSVLLD